LELFGSNFSDLDIFGRKNLIFSGFKSAKIHILAILKVLKTFFGKTPFWKFGPTVK